MLFRRSCILTLFDPQLFYFFCLIFLKILAGAVFEIVSYIKCVRINVHSNKEPLSQRFLVEEYSNCNIHTRNVIEVEIVNKNTSFENINVYSIMLSGNEHFHITLKQKNFSSTITLIHWCRTLRSLKIV